MLDEFITTVESEKRENERSAKAAQQLLADSVKVKGPLDDLVRHGSYVLGFATMQHLRGVHVSGS